MDFDLYWKENVLGINIINGRKRQEFEHANAVQEIGEFVMDLKLKYEQCVSVIANLLLIIVGFMMLCIPWLVCSGYITGRETVDNKNFSIEIYLIVGVSMITGILFVLVAFCWRKWWIAMKKRNFISKIQEYMNLILAKKYPSYAYSIIYPKKNEQLWCQLRISDQVLKCRADDEVVHTTYNDKTSLSIRNQSFGNNAYSPAKSPLLQ